MEVKELAQKLHHVGSFVSNCSWEVLSPLKRFPSLCKNWSNFCCHDGSLRSFTWVLVVV